APDGNSPSGNTANVGNVGVGHKTGDPIVDDLLNLSDQTVADDTKFLNSLPQDSIGNILNPTGNSASMLPSNSLWGSGSWFLNNVSAINDPNTTPAQLKQINQTNQFWTGMAGSQAILGKMNNSITKGEQSLNKNKNDSLNTFANGPEYAPNGTDWDKYTYLNGSTWSANGSSTPPPDNSSEDE
ncbi:MAG: hypothetical protein ACRC2M_20995, partial [Planktothrix sp.]